MASNNFRDSLNSLGWSRRDEPVNTSANTPILGRLQSLNPFGQGGYVRLPTTEANPGAPLPAPTRREEEEGWFACTYITPLPYSMTPCRMRSGTALPIVRSGQLRISNECSAALQPET
jgi:hypothetical protein